MQSTFEADRVYSARTAGESQARREQSKETVTGGKALRQQETKRIRKVCNNRMS